jgi:hypothetical protein
MSIETSTTAAKERAEAIRSGIDAIAEALKRVPQLIIEARKAEDWKALDYASWDDYVKTEFGTSLLKLDKATRKEWTVSLKDAGMTTREIAPVTNVSAMQVSRDSRGVTKVTAKATPEKSLLKDVGDTALSLTRIRDSLKAGTEVDCYTSEGLAHVVDLIREIINIGAKGEAL